MARFFSCLTALKQPGQLRLQLQSSHRIGMLLGVDAGLNNLVKQG